MGNIAVWCVAVWYTGFFAGFGAKLGERPKWCRWGVLLPGVLPAACDSCFLLPMRARRFEVIKAIKKAVIVRQLPWGNAYIAQVRTKYFIALDYGSTLAKVENQYDSHNIKHIINWVSLWIACKSYFGGWLEATGFFGFTLGEVVITCLKTISIVFCRIFTSYPIWVTFFFQLRLSDRLSTSTHYWNYLYAIILYSSGFFMFLN